MGGTSTAVTSPTRPRSIGPSGPLSSHSLRPYRHWCVLWCNPEARPPNLLMCRSMSALISSAKTRATISSVGSSVKRLPLTKRAVRPAFSIAWVIALPPPCTITGRIPTVCMKTTSTKSARSDSGSSMTEPPSLITVNFPWNLRMKPIASIKISALRMASSCTASPSCVPDPSRVESKPYIFLGDRPIVKTHLAEVAKPLHQGRARFGCGNWHDRHARVRWDLLPRAGGLQADRQ